MAKLYFKYGAMGSSKTASALITKFNYEERGMKVWLIKPATDTRDGDDVIKSRIGLSHKCRAIDRGEDLFEVFCREARDVDAIICDECQFLTKEQIDGARRIVDDFDLPVLCFGLRTDFLTHCFEGSARLFEVADSIAERKATVNARINDGKVVTEGEQFMLGGNDSYVAMCHRCWKKRIANENN